MEDKKKKGKTISIYLHQEIEDKLLKAAGEDSRSISGFLNMVLKKWFDKKREEKL